MNITILTPEKEIFQGAITSVRVPGTSGEFQVLSNHAPIVSSLEAGNVEVVTSSDAYRYYDEESGSIKTANEPGKKIVFRITGGFIEVIKNEVSLLVRGMKKDL